jgi:hypothetical protein
VTAIGNPERNPRPFEFPREHRARQTLTNDQDFGPHPNLRLERSAKTFK